MSDTTNGTLVLAPTLSGDGIKQHNRIVGGQGMKFWCEGENCQYCKQEAKEEETLTNEEVVTQDEEEQD